jgi:hypothetical protein
VSDSFCTTTKPATSQTCSGNPWWSQSAICNTQTCYTYSWKTWNCSATCWAWTMSVYCRRSDWVIVDDSYCSWTRPSTSCTWGISSYSVSITSTAWTSTSNYVSPTFTTTWLTNCSWCGYSVSCNWVSPMYWVIPSSSDTSPRRDTCYFTATKTSGCTISLPSTSECNKQSSWVWNCSYPWFNASWS